MSLWTTRLLAGLVFIAAFSAAGRADTTKGAWTRVSGTNDARFEARYEALPDGRVLALGGDRGWFSGEAWSSVEARDPVTGAWSPLTSLPVPLTWFFTLVLDDGRLLVLGDRKQTYIYHPADNTWTQAHDAPATMANGHGVGTPVQLDDGKVLMAGNFFDDTQSDRAFLFDPDKGTWAENDGRLSSKRGSSILVKLKDGRALDIGGIAQDPCCEATPAADVYDPALKTWTAVWMPPTDTDDGPHSYRERLNTLNPGSRWQPCVGVMADGQVLVAGGATFWSGGFVIRRSVLAFDPTSTSWREIAPMIDRRAGCRSAVAGDAFVVVGSGFFDLTWSWLQSAEIYRNGVWHRTNNFTIDPKISTFGGGAVLTGGGLLVIGGSRQLVPSPGGIAPGSWDAFFLPL